jgi:hypothetical protein
VDCRKQSEVHASYKIAIHCNIARARTTVRNTAFLGF